MSEKIYNRELTAIRKLLTVALLNAKLLTQNEVAEILDIERSAVSRRVSRIRRGSQKADNN